MTAVTNVAKAKARAIIGMTDRFIFRTSAMVLQDGRGRPLVGPNGCRLEGFRMRGLGALLPRGLAMGQELAMAEGVQWTENTSGIWHELWHEQRRRSVRHL